MATACGDEEPSDLRPSFCVTVPLETFLVLICRSHSTAVKTRQGEDDVGVAADRLPKSPTDFVSKAQLGLSWVNLAKKCVIFKENGIFFDENNVFVAKYDTFLSGKCRKLLKIAKI